MAHSILLSPLAQAGWTFDLPSFFVGLIVAWMIASLLVVFREPLREGIGAIRDRLRVLRERLTAGAERRYLDALRERLIDLHIGELAAPFEEVYLPPRFDPPTPRPTLAPDTTPPQPITLRTALRSTRRLAVLGESGSGRTALLVYLARVFAERESKNELRLEEDRLPVMIHLAEIAWDVDDDDPATPLIDVAITHSPRLVAANLASLLNSKIKSNDLIVLLDGWDEVAQSDRDAAQRWLAALAQRYPDHRYVITASPRDAEPLRGAGFACLSIQPPDARSIKSLAERWAAVAEGGTSDAAMLAEAARQPPGVSPRPLDVTLAVSVWRKRGSMPLNIPAAYDKWIDLALSESGVSDTLSARAVLGRLAWVLFEEDRLIAARDETAAIAAETLPPGEPGKSAPAITEIAGNLATASALFVALGQGVAFAHRRIAAYLAAAHARDTGQAIALAARLDDPAWEDVVYFFAALGDTTPLINAALAQPHDLFRTTFKRLGRWASIAPADAAWRNRVMGDMVKVLMSPSTPEPLRDDLLRVVVSTRDKGLAFLFKQATGRPEPALRRLGLRGFALMRREADVAHVAPLIQDADASVRSEALHALGEIGGQAAVDALAQALLDLDDESRRVAAESLANCGKPGWELLQEGASLPDDKGEDVVRVRRASVYGLARTGEVWARDLLMKLERQDPQWFVRSGATEALRLMSEESGESAPIDLTPLDRDNLGWLIQWAASKGQPIGMGKLAAQALRRALEDLDPNVRLAAVHTYAALGDVEIIPVLRARLTDDQPHVRDAAYRALEEIARRKNESVPQ
ncbi:MAG TPA: HEAT repeat domain-containing protein [Anaerolineae bacterium]